MKKIKLPKIKYPLVGLRLPPSKDLKKFLRRKTADEKKSKKINMTFKNSV